MTLASATTGTGDAAKLPEKGTLSSESRFQESEPVTVGKGGRKSFVVASWRSRGRSGISRDPLLRYLVLRPSPHREVASGFSEPPVGTV